MKNKVIRIIWISAIILATVSILGHYKIVLIRGISAYNYEMLLVSFIILLMLKLFKK